MPRRCKASGPVFRYFVNDSEQLKATLRAFLNDGSGYGMVDVHTCLPVRSYFVSFSELSPSEQQMVGRRVVQFVNSWLYHNGAKATSVNMTVFVAPVDWQKVTLMLAHPPLDLRIRSKIIANLTFYLLSELELIFSTFSHQYTRTTCWKA